jgi:uncharacterized small protein (DUF1192 family)
MKTKIQREKIYKLIFLVIFLLFANNSFCQLSAPTTVTGTTYPQMEIISPVNSSSFSSGIKFTLKNSNTHAYEIFNHGATNALCIYDRTAGQYRMYFDATGAIAVGTTTIRSGCLLTVKGKIAAQEFEIVTDVTLPDYVFEKNYKLRSLKDLESYISQNKRLPEAPSANQVKKDGYKMVEMDNLLLKKVEELSLYVIALNKKLEATEAELAKMKAEKQ